MEASCKDTGLMSAHLKMCLSIGFRISSLGLVAAGLSCCA